MYLLHDVTLAGIYSRDNNDLMQHHAGKAGSSRRKYTGNLNSILMKLHSNFHFDAAMPMVLDCQFSQT
jgi:hypothetical protein